jgi:protein TonB
MRKLTKFIIISLVIHILFLYFIKLPSNNKTKTKEPIYVDIIKKIPNKQVLPRVLEKQRQPLKNYPQPKKIIPDKFLQENTPKIPDISDSNKNEPEKKILSQDEQKHTLPKITPNESETETKKIEENLQPKKDIEAGNKQTEKPKISKDQLSHILNPKDIIDDIAKKEQKKEDEVDFNRFEVKYTSYFYKFKQRLYNVWRYPSTSIMRGEQGTVRIKFSILKDGTITNINVIGSSGYSELDKAALDALKNMGKVPLPDSFGINILNVDGYFIYSIGGIWIR